MAPFDPHNVTGYYKLVDHIAVEVRDLLAWARYFDDADPQVRLTKVPHGDERLDQLALGFIESCRNIRRIFVGISSPGGLPDDDI
ncbi:MAG: hypothetical protein V4502_08145 [Pseudomonadota bacterium]